MVRQIINKVTSAVTTAMLVFTTFAAAIPVTTYAASNTVRSKKHVTKTSDQTTAGYGTFDFDSNSSGYTFSVDSKSDHLTKTPNTPANKSKWIWQEQDEEKGGIKGLGNAWLANLSEDSSFSVWYKNVTKQGTTKKYDVKVTYDNARGAISGAYGKNIAIFDGQLGAVRFRGFKHIRCTIYVYEHGSSTLISGDDNKLHFRFIDIDCNQAVESMCPGRTDWYMLGKHLHWAGQAKCDTINATYENTVVFNGYGDEASGKDVTDNAIQFENSSDPAEKKEYREALRHTFSVGFTPSDSLSNTYQVRYFAGGGAGIGTQKNGAFFSFDGGLTLPPPTVDPDAELSIDKVSDKYVHKVGDTWDYTITVKNVTSESKAITAENVKVTDSVDSRLKVNSVTASQGSASHNGNSVTADLGDLAQDAVETVTINVTALESSNGQQLYNRAKAEADNSNDAWDDDGNYVNSADVTVDKVVDKYEFAVGEKANFTVKVKNNKGIATNTTISDELPSGMKLDYDSVKISGLPASVSFPVTPKDITNQLNKELFYKSETKTITATKEKNGDNGWAYKINYLPAGSTATITFSATATEAGNGKEQQNVAKATGDNFSTAQDDAEYYVNTPSLTLSKKYINPYKDEKKDNRCDNEFRIFEKETGYEKVQYQVTAKSSGPAGTVAKDVVIVLKVQYSTFRTFL